ncbi:hypothetical protein CC85DRAFT_282076 [Cutaneotrichosporon oleaginosum]|uniref:Probable RNA-binding protein 18 n=1 Tax=Cutaneotrichosporon oleaginosum TaxID=879819 RepID=A0A0J0XY24_9TREE|nr:uncharacterized protein CC85DRAFT_282076 [Cutaneotrichosporon oleaginosum]KLT45938.1 hypothetical protein CC85DRAFT_282076 [Cutaneotrichosporon oleaginosum]TXT06635.1 hypothetical protein COLE_05966 [Cutaneotrichosporon oleaginosum]
MASSGKPDRLFVGNLAPSVDEYTLVQVFSKYGKITKLDLMVHHSGPQKGKPRGYAFVEYESKDDAVKALVKLHDRPLRGRKLVVTYANAAPIDDGGQPFKRRTEIKPTSLSLLKARKPQSTDAQIAAMEAKLAALRNRPDRSPTPERVAADELEAEILRELAEREGPEGSRVGTREASAARTMPSPLRPAGATDRGASRTASPMPTSMTSIAGPAGLPAKPVAAMEALKPRGDSRTASPRRHDRYTPSHDPRSRDRSPRRDDSPRYRDEPRSRERSPRRHEPRGEKPSNRARSPCNEPHSPRRDRQSPRPVSGPSARMAGALAGVAGLPKKPTF